MNNSVSYAIGAAVGGSVGYFISAVVADYIDEKNMRDNAPSTISEDEDESTLEEDEESSRESRMKKKPKQKREKKDYTTHFVSVGRPDLAALARKYNDGVIEDETPGVVTLIADNEVIENIAPDPNAITIISNDDFTDNSDEYEVVELSYYADEIMIGEDENIIRDPEDIVGDDALVSFGMLSGDPDIVYVRNPKTRALYEIVRMSIKYAIDSEAERIVPRKGLKRGIDYDEVNSEEANEEANS